MNTILAINAHLKYVEYLLNVFDNYPGETTLSTVREKFEKQFSTRHVLLNQNFGIYRLLPLILIKEEYKNDKKELTDVIKQIKVIRESVAHNDFFIHENGYVFKNQKKNGEDVSFTYDEFIKFIHKVENEFYNEKIAAKNGNGEETVC